MPKDINSDWKGCDNCFTYSKDEIKHYKGEARGIELFGLGKGCWHQYQAIFDCDPALGGRLNYDGTE